MTLLDLLQNARTPFDLTTNSEYYTTFPKFSINPKSITLTVGAVTNLRTFVRVRKINRTAKLVTCTLAGGQTIWGRTTNRKSPLHFCETRHRLEDIASTTWPCDLLVHMLQLHTGFRPPSPWWNYWPNKISLQDYKKWDKAFSLIWTWKTCLCWLPTHKSRHCFEGTKIVCVTNIEWTGSSTIRCNTSNHEMLASSFHSFGIADGLSAAYGSWTISPVFGPHPIAGQSMRAGWC